MSACEHSQTGAEASSLAMPDDNARGPVRAELRSDKDEPVVAKRGAGSDSPTWERA